MSQSDIANRIEPSQRELLREFFGRSLQGARHREENFTIPVGLKRLTLEQYYEIARRTIRAGKDIQGVQRIRLRLAERALGQLDNVFETES